MDNKVQTMSVLMLKMPFQTRHFNINQKVWVQYLTGDQAAKVVGRFRGNKRYTSAWIHWRSKAKMELMKEFQQIDVDARFANRYNLHRVEYEN